MKWKRIIFFFFSTLKNQNVEIIITKKLSTSFVAFNKLCKSENIGKNLYFKYLEYLKYNKGPISLSSFLTKKSKLARLIAA